MPTYDYECSKCGEVFELFHSITDPARTKLLDTDPKGCECDAPISRLIGTGGGIIFKGSGFYQTDYRSDSYNKAAKADSEAGSSKSDSSGKDASKKDSSKSDTKSASSTKSSGEPAKPSNTGSKSSGNPSDK